MSSLTGLLRPARRRLLLLMRLRLQNVNIALSIAMLPALPLDAATLG